MSKERIDIPADYRPNADPRGVTLYWDEEILEMLDGIDEKEFKAGFMEIFLTAKQYALTFDETIQPDVDQFQDKATRVFLKTIYKGWKRGLDGWRESSYRKLQGALSRTNKSNGNSSNDDSVPAGDILYAQVKKWLDSNPSAKAAGISLDEAIAFARANPDIPANSAMIKLLQAKMYNR